MPRFPSQMDPVEGSREIVDRELERLDRGASSDPPRTLVAERSAEAHWRGGLRDGTGSVKVGSGTFQGAYSLGSRFEDAKGSNPEELIAAAEASCFSMALSSGLERAGFKPKEIHTRAKAVLEKAGDGFAIAEIALETDVKVHGIDKAAFREEVEKAKQNCPVSRALAGVKITLNARHV